jgi:hypothetical protein
MRTGFPEHVLQSPLANKHVLPHITPNKRVVGKVLQSTLHAVPWQ